MFLEDQAGESGRYQRGGINIISPGKITWLTTETGLPDNVILSMHEDEAE